MFLRLLMGLVAWGVLAVSACSLYPPESMVADYIPPVGGELPTGLTGTTGFVQI